MSVYFLGSILIILGGFFYESRSCTLDLVSDLRLDFGSECILSIGFERLMKSVWISLGRN